MGLKPTDTVHDKTQAMSVEANKALTHRYQAAFNQNELAALDEIAAPDLISHALRPGVPAGLEGAKPVHQGTVAAFPDLHFEIEDLIAEGDKVIVRFTGSGTHRGDLMGLPPTGKSLQIAGISVFRIVGGRVVERWATQDNLGFYQQLGIPLSAA